MERPTRRRVLAAGGGVVAALAGCTGRRGTTATPPGTATDAPTETPTGTPTDTPTDTPAGTSDEHVAWRQQVDGPVEADPAAGGGTASVGTAEGTVHALAGGDGTERWRATVDAPVQHVAVVDDRTLAVVGTNELFEDHELVALGADGIERWRFAPEEWWLTVVGVRDGTVYVATGDDAIGPDGQTLYALARDDGGVRWSAEVGDPMGGVVTDRTVYVPSYGRLYAYDHDGGRRWVRDGIDYGYRTLVVAEGTVALVTETEDRSSVAVGLSAADGSERWRLDDWFVTSLRVADGTLFAGGEHVAALDPATGDPHWQSDARGSIYDAPVVDGTLYAGGRALAAVATADGSVRWSIEPDAHLLDPVAVLDGTVFVHASKTRDDRNRHLSTFDAGDGAQRWTFAAEASMADPVVVDDAGDGSDTGGRLVAGSDAGVVYGFE